MPDIAKVGLQADSSSLKVATKDMSQMLAAATKLSEAATKLLASADRMNAAFTGVGTSAATTAKAINTQAAATENLTKANATAQRSADAVTQSSTRLVRSYHQIEESERSLAERAGLRVEATKAQLDATAKTIAAQSRQMGITDRFIAVKDAETEAIVANTAARKINSRTQYELGVLAGEVASGNTSRIKRSVPALLNSMHLTEKLFSPVGLAITGVTTAVALLTVAWAKGEGEALAYNKALILTGNAAGVSADQMGTLSARMDAIPGVTQHAAAGVLTLVAATGQFSGSAVPLVARAALQMEQLGQKTETTIQQFESLAKDPVAALTKLNDTQHFLTLAVYDRVQALQQAGKTEQAAAVAEHAYADAANTRFQEERKNLGLIQEGWGGIKNAIKETGDALANIGRAQTLAMKAQALITQIDQLNNIGSAPVRSKTQMETMGAVMAARAANLKTLHAQLNKVRLQQVAEGFKDVNDAIKAQAVKDAIQARQTLAQYASPDVKLTQALKQAAQTRMKALYGVVDPSEQARIEQEYKAQVTAAYAARDSAIKKLTPKAPPDILDAVSALAVRNGNAAQAATTKGVMAHINALQKLRALEQSGMGGEAGRAFSRYNHANATINAAGVDQTRAAADRGAAFDNLQKGISSSLSRAGGVSPQGVGIMAQTQTRIAQVDQLYGQIRAAIMANVNLTQSQQTEVVRQATKQREAVVRQLTQQSLQSQLSDGAAMFSGFAQLAQAFTDGQGKRNSVAFAAMKSFQIAAATLQMYAAIMKALNSPFPENIAAVGTVAAEAATIISAIKGASYGGGRATGGPVTGGMAYRVNERGPEVYQANGQQYMIPHRNGNVVPMQAYRGGGGNVTIQYSVDARGAGPDEIAKLAQMRQETVKQVQSSFIHFQRYGYFPS